MKAYEISKGTQGLLLKNNSGGAFDFDGQWDTEDFTTQKNLMFTDPIIDSLRVYNQNSGFKASDTVYKLAERGYVVFHSDITTTYLLAVPYHSVNIS